MYGSRSSSNNNNNCDNNDNDNSNNPDIKLFCSLIFHIWNKYDDLQANKYKLKVNITNINKR